MRTLLAFTITATVAFGSLSAGTHKTIYVHGLKPFNNLTSCQGQATCSTGWSQQKYTGADVLHVGYFSLVNPTLSFSTSSQKSGSVQVLSILNAECRRDQGKSCEFICGSMGCYTISYVLATYNGDLKYNVVAVSALASAGGGSEVANLGTGIVAGLASALTSIFGGALTSAILSTTAFGALTTSYARSRWDHNRNTGAIFYHKAGDKGLWPLNWIWEGTHDRMVSFHSACGYREIRKFSQCGGENVKTGLFKKKYISPWTGHVSSGNVSNKGIGDAQHGYMSKTASAQTKR